MPSSACRSRSATRSRARTLLTAITTALECLADTLKAAGLLALFVLPLLYGAATHGTTIHYTEDTPRVTSSSHP